MANLRVQPDALRSVAAKLDDYNSNFNSKLLEVKNTNTNLSNVWKGDDANKYIGAVNQQAQTMDELHNYLSEIAEYMRATAKTYEDVMISNMNNINM